MPPVMTSHRTHLVKAVLGFGIWRRALSICWLTEKAAESGDEAYSEDEATIDKTPSSASYSAMKPAYLKERLARPPEPTARGSATHQPQPPPKGILRRRTGVALSPSKSAKICWLWRPRMLTVQSLDEAEKVELFWSQTDLSEVTCGCCGGRCRERDVSVAQNPKGQRDLLCSGCAEEQPRHLVSTKPGRGSVGWLKIYPEPAPLFQEEEQDNQEEEKEDNQQEEEEDNQEEEEEEQEERQEDEEQEEEVEEEEDGMPMSARLLQALAECSKLPRPSILSAQPQPLNRTCSLLRVSFEGIRKVVEGSESASPEPKDALFWNSESQRSILCARCGGFQSRAESFVAESWHGEMDMICKDCSSDWPGHLLSSVPGAMSAGSLKLQPSLSWATFDEFAEYESRRKRSQLALCDAPKSLGHDGKSPAAEGSCNPFSKLGKVDMDIRDEDSTTEPVSDTETESESASIIGS
ncbi:unnamed protein product [Symbiodinium necroappetens]|uniref:Uncharacterized protein n=1 Tax=Symbiodinium necroappetens TaxID=1628268 RepID=A0A812XYH9_9DINO|nr:unnamed protein product [Symbiodinium necroappetens]